MEVSVWRKCSTCKKPIGFSARYWACNVSTCNRKRTGLVFCSVECWDGHLPVVRHREAWSVEQTAPTREQWEKEEAGLTEALPSSPASPRAGAASPAPSKGVPMENHTQSAPKDVLVVASKLKAYIRARSQMNTSAEVMEALSDTLRRLCDEAINHARQDGRKTVMARDFR